MGLDAAGSLITAEYFPCKVLVEGGAREATIVAAAGVSAKPWREGENADEAVLTAESPPCKVIIGGGARLATVIAAKEASAESWSPTEATRKTAAKAGWRGVKKNSSQDAHRR